MKSWNSKKLLPLSKLTVKFAWKQRNLTVSLKNDTTQNIHSDTCSSMPKMALIFSHGIRVFMQSGGKGHEEQPEEYQITRRFW
jgi:hypothetical protein